MTEQIHDHRVSGYLGAREALDAAQRIRTDHNTSGATEPLPETYWSTLAEAAVLAKLARADAPAAASDQLLHLSPVDPPPRVALDVDGIIWRRVTPHPHPKRPPWHGRSSP
jgi:hypothetical protein